VRLHLELGDVLGSLYENIEVMLCVCTGTPCVAQCSMDHCWYRAEIINVISSSVADDAASAVQVVVFFTDYGSLETLDSRDKYDQILKLLIYRGIHECTICPLLLVGIMF
jgi:Tudor domain